MESPFFLLFVKALLLGIDNTLAHLTWLVIIQWILQAKDVVKS